jgi:sugar phosphate isomerase/epimerase
MNTTRRGFLGGMAAGTAFAALPGWCTGCCGCKEGEMPRIALQLYSIHKYISGDKGKKGAGMKKALEEVAKIGYAGVEFAGYDGCGAADLKKMLADNGLVVCGTHVHNEKYGFDTKKWTYDPEVLKKTCEFELAYGNNLIICPGGGNFPPGCTWSTGRGGEPCKPTKEIDEFAKRLVEFYNKAAVDAAKMGCKIGLHNHTWEHAVKLLDGTSFWDYFFTNTSKEVCMEQDVGWSTCAGVDPCAQYEKYPGRSPTLHAKENGMGKDVKEFDAILGQPGKPGATPVNWDGLLPATRKDGVKWWVVECERHFDDFTAVVPSYKFLKGKGL